MNSQSCSRFNYSYLFAPILFVLLTISGNTRAQDEQDCEQLRQFTFSWQFTEHCGMQPRGGTSRGANVKLDPEPHPGWLSLQEEGLSDFERDRRAILAMAGPYQTTFDFIEVIGFTPDYEPQRPYQSWGTEYVYVVEDRGDFISLQHIMVMVYEDEEGNISEPMVMKHWRQDWHYEKREVFNYAGMDKFETEKLPRRGVKGHWAQAVYQVDDSPRYEAIGKWEHYPNFSTWESETSWRPLPRRESSVRDDYDVLIGTNRHTIEPSGWVHEQANYKTALNEAGELAEDNPYLARELGVNRYRRIVDFDFAPSDQYWEQTGAFWEDVRRAWDEIIDNNDDFVLNTSIDGVPLFAPLFGYAEELASSEDYDRKSGREFIRDTLEKYVDY